MRMLLTLAASVLFLVANVPYASATWTWQALDYPSAAYTQINGISGNTIVGSYSFAHQNAQGFVYNGSSWTTLSYPGASYTTVRGISNASIVGYYADATKEHGFVYNGGAWTTLDYPGSTGTELFGVSGSNIVGIYRDASDAYHGFTYDGNTWTPLNELGFPLAISGTRIVGYGSGGFVYEDGKFTPLSYSEAADVTPCGIDNNTIVGLYQGYDYQSHGFLFDGSTWTTLEYPGEPNTKPVGISGNNIVGYYQDSGGYFHGFLLTTPRTRHLLPSRSGRSADRTTTKRWLSRLLTDSLSASAISATKNPLPGSVQRARSRPTALPLLPPTTIML